MFNKLKIQQLEDKIDKLSYERDYYYNESMCKRADLNNACIKQLKEENSSLSSYIDTLEKEIKRLEDENMRIREAYNIEIIKNKL